MNPRSRIIVLAAGKGSRMGGPKATMSVGGRPWAHVQSDRLRRIGVPVRWVVSPRTLEALTSTGGIDPSSTVTANPDAPMFASVLAGLRAEPRPPIDNPTGGVFILPIDVPAPRPEAWERLEQAPEVGVPVHNGVRGHPVFLAWPWALRLLDCVPGSKSSPDDARLDTLIAPVARMIDVDDPDVAVNLNTPEDVRRWLARSDPDGARA